MRLCRYLRSNTPRVGLWRDAGIADLAAAAAHLGRTPPASGPEADLVPLLGAGEAADDARAIDAELDDEAFATLASRADSLALLPAVARPPKILCLAGNYAEHVAESGDLAAERARTFPYVFLKPSTTLAASGGVFDLPASSPDHIDWEVELGVVIGRGGRDIPESGALEHVAGYTVVDDISDRRFRPNPQRIERSRDRFFDWLHGKWHDGSCPVGPCVLDAAARPDPQSFDLRLRVDDTLHQSASTAEQIFPVAALIAFISSFVRLEPGDLISTGTPAGVGAPKGVYLRPGNVVRAEIEGIGELVTTIR